MDSLKRFGSVAMILVMKFVVMVVKENHTQVLVVIVIAVK